MICLTNVVLTCDIRILIMCQDTQHNETCYDVSHRFFTSESNTVNIVSNWIYIPASSDLMENLGRVNKALNFPGKRSDICDIMIVIGNEAVVNSAAIIAEGRNIPVLVYGTFNSKLPVSTHIT